MEVRDAQPDDLPVVRELVCAAFWESYDDAGRGRPSQLPEVLAVELDELTARYDALLVVGPAGQPIGCVGVRPLGDATSAVMNRLYVQPSHRRAGLGRRLAAEAVARAGQLGYGRIVLDVIPRRSHVIALYRSLGFDEIEPFVDYPFKMVFLGRGL